MKPLLHFWSHSLRHRLLIGGVGLFVFTLLAASVLKYALLQSFLDARAQAQAIALAQNFSVSSRAWVLSNDLAGLQEMARATKDFPDVRYAMLIAPDGQVLAHSDAAHDGHYLKDATSLALLHGKLEAQLLPDGPDMLDAAAPILADGRLVGWARVGIGMDYMRDFRDQVIGRIALLLLFSSAIGGFSLWWLTGGLMRGLDRLLEGVRRLEAGERGGNLVAVAGEDELARLARAFNALSAGLAASERELRESEARWQFALEGSGLGVWDWEVASDKVYFSQRLNSMLGFEQNELGDNFSDWKKRVHPDDLARCLADVEQHLYGDSAAYVNEHRIRAKDGSWVWALARGQVVERDAAGKPMRMIGTYQDISERRAAEAERAQLQQQLQHAQKLEAIGQLTGGIAHDFNNILGAILGYTGLTLDRYRQDLPEKAVGYLNEVQKAGERARDLIQKMLAFARGGGGEDRVLEPRPLVREVIKMLHGTLPSSLELVENIDENLPEIRLDPGHLHQILTNLIINARDATNGEGHIEVGLRLTTLVGETCAICHQPVQGIYVELAVRDDGSGIAPEVLSRIFEPFFTTKEVGRGSGMGLAMVLGIVREHNGHVLVETRTDADHGSTFRLFFPPAAPKN